jgi:hypothetical protein
MKLIWLFLIFIPFFAFGQAPEKVSFQSVVYDNQNKLAANRDVKVRLSILSGTIDGTVVYQEIHSVKTNGSGLFTLEVGNGNSTIGTFGAINWGSAPHFLKREFDLTGGDNYSISGIGQILSVPYAIYASVSDTTLKVPDDSPLNEIQQLTRRGDTIFISEGNYIVLSGFSQLQGSLFDNSKNLFGGSGGEDADLIIQTRDENFLILGTSSSSDGDISDGNYGEDDILLLKIDLMGNKIWDKTFGGNGYEWAASLKELNDGSFIFVGTTASYGNDVTDGNNERNDVWVVKINSSGGKLWDKVYFGNGIGFETRYSIDKVNNGGFIIAGGTNLSQSEIRVLKIDENGNQIWFKNFSGSGYDDCSKIIQTSDGGFILIGGTTSNDGDIPESFKGEADIWVIKLSSEGDIEWTKTYGGSAADWGYSIIQTPDNNYILTGYTFSSDGDISKPIIDSTTFNFVVMKINSDGEKVWDNTFLGMPPHGANNIYQTLDGGLIIAGSLPRPSPDERDALVVKLRENGAIEWQKTFGGSKKDEGKSIIQTSDGGYLLIGNTRSNDGDFLGQNKGGNDVFYLKLKPNGEKQ